MISGADLFEPSYPGVAKVGVLAMWLYVWFSTQFFTLKGSPLHSSLTVSSIVSADNSNGVAHTFRLTTASPVDRKRRPGHLLGTPVPIWNSNMLLLTLSSVVCYGARVKNVSPALIADHEKACGAPASHMPQLTLDFFIRVAMITFVILKHVVSFLRWLRLYVCEYIKIIVT